MNATTAQPLPFRGDDGLLFGWLHMPAGGGAPLGVVICNPFGFEELCAHRSLRRLAEDCAAAGLPTLRFDYHGTGDSAGRDDEEALPGAWLSSIHAAAESLKRQAGVERLVFIGLRLGALLAAIAASQRADVDGLVALAPIVSGRAYVREMRALQMASAAGSSEDVFEAAGFVIHDSMRTAVSAMDGLKLPGVPAQRVLILDRDDLSPDPRWAQHLASAGVQVESEPLIGYAGLVADPHRSVVPEESFAKVVRWVSALGQAAVATPRTERATALPVSVAPLELEVDGRRVREQAITVGAAGTLCGVLTLPADVGEASASPSRGGIVLLNAGAIRRVGPSRLYVRLARRWAARGYTVLRLDLSGLGDSPPRGGIPDNLTYSASAPADVADAVQFLQSVAGVPDCYLVGLCSGAYHAFKAAVAGLPLKGVVLINPLTFFWKEGMSLDGARAQDYQAVSFGGNVSRSLRDPARWRRLLSGGFSLRRVLRRSMMWMGGLAYRRVFGALRGLGFAVGDHLPSELQRIVRQRVSLQFVFASNDAGLDVLRAEAGDTVTRLQRDGALGITIVPDADHLFTRSAARERLVIALDALIGVADAAEPGGRSPERAGGSAGRLAPSAIVPPAKLG